MMRAHPHLDQDVDVARLRSGGAYVTRQQVGQARREAGLQNAGGARQGHGPDRPAQLRDIGRRGRAVDEMRAGRDQVGRETWRRCLGKVDAKGHAGQLASRLGRPHVEGHTPTAGAHRSRRGLGTLAVAPGQYDRQGGLLMEQTRQPKADIAVTAQEAE